MQRPTASDKIDLKLTVSEEISADQESVRIMDGFQFDSRDLAAEPADVDLDAEEWAELCALSVGGRPFDDVYLAKFKALSIAYYEAARRRAGINLSKDRLQILGPDGPYAETYRRAEERYLVNSLFRAENSPAVAVVNARRAAAGKIKPFLTDHRVPHGNDGSLAVPELESQKWPT